MMYYYFIIVLYIKYACRCKKQNGVFLLDLTDFKNYYIL